jgi:protein tyrosine/serine phosphatase
MASDTPLPSPPFIDIQGLRNFRDCGGYPVASTDGRKVIRSGIVFRSSEPSMVTDEGISILRDQLNITHVYDLRSQTEIEHDTRNGGRHVKEWDGAKRIFVPVFLHEDCSPEAIALRYANFSSESSEVSANLHFLAHGGVEDEMGGWGWGWADETHDLEI